MTDKTINTMMHWRNAAFEVIDTIRVDPKLLKILDGTSLVLTHPATETVLLRAPRDQVAAIQRAFPDVAIAEPATIGVTDVVPASASPAGGTEPDVQIDPFSKIKIQPVDPGHIDPFEPVKTMIPRLGTISGVIKGIK